MTTLSDARFEALRTQLFTGATSDMLLQWLQANGATSNSVPDAWREMLESKAPGYYMAGDGTNWAILGQAIPLLIAEGWEVEFTAIRVDRTGTAATTYWGGSPGGVSGNTRSQVTDSGNAQPDRYQFRDNGTYRPIENAFQDIGQGDTFTFKQTHNAGDTVCSFFLNGEFLGTLQTLSDNELDVIGAGGATGVNAIANGSAILSLKVINTTTGETWHYDLDEGTGTVSANTGNTGSAFDATWQNANGWTETSRSDYQRNDVWFELLGSLGYTGSLNDRELAFWEAGGTFPP